MTIIALLCVDRWGRRKFLLTGAILMGVAILCLGLVTHLQDHSLSEDTCSENDICVQSAGDHSNLYNQSHQTIYGNHGDDIHNLTNLDVNTLLPNVTDGTPLLHGDEAGKVVAFIALMTYVAAYAIGFGPGREIQSFLKEDFRGGEVIINSVKISTSQFK